MTRHRRSEAGSLRAGVPLVTAFPRCSAIPSLYEGALIHAEAAGLVSALRSRKETHTHVGLIGQETKMNKDQTTLKRVILCIDDDEGMLLYQRTLLERSGYAVITASSAQMGLGLLNACEFDAVILDYDLPDTDGCDIASEIKCLRPEMTLILLSGIEVPIVALAMVDAFVSRVEASRDLLPMIAALFGQIHHDTPGRGRARTVSSPDLLRFWLDSSCWAAYSGSKLSG